MSGVSGLESPIRKATRNPRHGSVSAPVAERVEEVAAWTIEDGSRRFKWVEQLSVRVPRRDLMVLGPMGGRRGRAKINANDRNRVGTVGI